MCMNIKSENNLVCHHNGACSVFTPAFMKNAMALSHRLIFLCKCLTIFMTIEDVYTWGSCDW